MNLLSKINRRLHVFLILTSILCMAPACQQSQYPRKHVRKKKCDCPTWSFNTPPKPGPYPTVYLHHPLRSDASHATSLVSANPAIFPLATSH